MSAEQRKCDVTGDNWCCVRPSRNRKSGSLLCNAHTAQMRSGKAFTPIQTPRYPGETTDRSAPCKFNGCANNQFSAGYCPGHNKQRRLGQTLRALRKWEPHPWLPGWGRPWTYSKSGYAYVSKKDNGVEKRLEHRVVMEYIIGRALLPTENIHHRNGMRDDNRPENLELWSTMQPSGQDIAHKVQFAREILALYGDMYPAA